MASVFFSETRKLISSQTFKALVALFIVWAVVFSLIINVDVLTGARMAGSVGVLSQLVHGQKSIPLSSQRVTDGSSNAWPEKHDTLIAYVYSESAFGRDNFRYFLKMGLHQAADFVFIFNGAVSVVEEVPNWSNIRVVQRNNTCYDMGAVGEVMRTDDLWKYYKKFISINASIRGPFVPYWSNACWSDMYLNKITDTVKFVGLTASCWPRGHIQSMIYATDDVGMGILLDPDHAATGVPDVYGTADDTVGLSGCYNGHKAAVHSEIGLATLITNAGYQVDAMMAAYHHQGGLEEYCRTTGNGSGDVLLPNQYFGIDVHPYETIFFKTNRKIHSVGIGQLTEWHLRRNVTAMDLCHAW
ncbi:hypothetical protein SEPCBS57363_005848 [Sporothrix epigloea]|uniref:Uncharacterized protein n=1 Tax=Sporothrix epigloea TaxID=1892477 RepID=A0ABP0DZT9_9PEZI